MRLGTGWLLWSWTGLQNVQKEYLMPDPVDERVANRRAAMQMAEQQALQGDPVCGAFFGFLHSVKDDPIASFMDDFYEVDFDDDSDECRPC
jgi:hypothetical protein